jgi:hypothetical protein
MLAPSGNCKFCEVNDSKISLDSLCALCEVFGLPFVGFDAAELHFQTWISSENGP